jgi:glutamate racemase
MSNKLSIGIFDSGLGGLTVLKALMTAMPNESYIYFGDTAHVPYGNKSKETVTNYALQICQFLKKKNVKLIIVACNTATSLSIKTLKSQLTIPIIDVITPIQHILKSNKQIKTIGIIGTYNTVVSKAYNNTILSVNSKINIYATPCPLFVPIIEEGLANHQIAYLMVKKYLAPLIAQNIQMLILGCTHYPIIKNTIVKSIPQTISIVDSAEATTNYVQDYLLSNNLQSGSKSSSLILYISDYSIHFEQFAKEYLQLSNLQLQTIQL